MGSGPVGERLIGAFASGDQARLGEVYADGAVLWTALTGPLRGRDAIARYLGELRSAFPGMRVAVHDEFGSPDGARACIRLHLDWHNTGPLRGHPASGRQGEMAAMHSFRLEAGQIAEQIAGVSGFRRPRPQRDLRRGRRPVHAACLAAVVGDNTFHMPRQELVAWNMAFPERTLDPAPAIASVTLAPQP